MSIYRSEGAAITDAVRKEIGEVGIEQLEFAMSRAGIRSTDVQRRVINRLYNMKKSEQAVEIQASQLVDQGFEKYAQLTIPAHDASGNIIAASRVKNDNWSIAIQIRTRNMEFTFVVKPDELVRIWPVNRDIPASLREAGMREKTSPRPPYFEEEPTEDWVAFTGQQIRKNASDFFGRRVVLDHMQIDGILTALSYTGGSQYTTITIDHNEAYRVRQSDLFKVYPRDEGIRRGRYPWATHPDLVAQSISTPDPEDLRRARERAQQIQAEEAEMTCLSAYGLATGRRDYRGLEVRANGTHGILTDYELRNDGKVILIVDGKIVKTNYGGTVRVWRKGS